MTDFTQRLGITDASPQEAARPGDDAGKALTVGAEHLNKNGTLHGGVMATILDTAMGDAVRSHLGEDEETATVSMTITYLAPAKEGDELRASAEIRKQGSSLVLVESDLTRPEDDKAIAHGVATFTVLGGD
ncbi:MAG: PaaI family thioesterase [Mobilicoccus sp.]|nr:PaaI family thioesterase [Mobilicoccus sp.]